MSISEDDLLLYAEALYSSADGDADQDPAQREAAFRASASRAYYAAMHRCRRFHRTLAAAGVVPPGQVRSHAKLIQQLTHPILKSHPLREQSISVGSQLMGMKGAREVVDYDLQLSILACEAKDMIEQAREIFEQTA